MRYSTVVFLLPFTTLMFDANFFMLNIIRGESVISYIYGTVQGVIYLFN